MRRYFTSFFVLMILTVTVQAVPQKTKDQTKMVQTVKTGVYLMNIYDLDMSSNSFYLDAYIWFRWQGSINPLRKLEFLNAVDKWGMTITPGYETPQVLSDKSNYQWLRVEGRFYQPFDLTKYPIDTQKLQIILENQEHEETVLKFEKDTQSQSGIRESLQIPGWDIIQADSIIKSNSYPTNFGDTDIQKQKSTYSTFLYSLSIKRPVSYFLWKLLLPLLVVMLSNVGAVLLHPSYIDARVMMPAGALLTTVFLQQSYTSNLPDIGYMVLMDQIYIVSYILIIVSLIQIIITANWAQPEDEESFEKVRKYDYKFLGIQSGVFLVSIIFLVLINLE